MFKSFCDIKYPYRDGRNTIPKDEIVATWAYKMLRDEGEDDLYYLQEDVGPYPTPNASARVESRRRVGNSAEWITIRGSADWFARVEEWIDRALAIEGF